MLMSKLLPSERALAAAMQQLEFGRIESMRIFNGEVVLDPWPLTVRTVKFGSEHQPVHQFEPGEFQLKRQVVELFKYVRGVRDGEILCLEVRHGLPFAMEVLERPIYATSGPETIPLNQMANSRTVANGAHA